MKVKSESEVAESCLTLGDAMDCSPPGPSIHGIFQARVLEWSAIAFSSHPARSILFYKEITPGRKAISSSFSDDEVLITGETQLHWKNKNNTKRKHVRKPESNIVRQFFSN